MPHPPTSSLREAATSLHATAPAYATRATAPGPAPERTAQLAAPPPGALALVLPSQRVVPLEGRVLTLGSARGSDLRLDDRAVSARHCRLVPTATGYEAHDLDSTNGTWVEGVRVRSARLSAGVELRLGRTVLGVRLLAPSEDLPQPAHRELAPGVPLVGEDPAIEQLRSAVARYARLPYPVLVRGETGSGKELVARALHKLSPRAAGPFVAVNAAAIAPELVESELFGHERGAFTGAAARRRGYFEEAHKGTLFLDELGELPLGLQARLLRVLESGELRRVGGEHPLRVDVRVVAATHRDLAARVRDGHFREDLRFRLEVLCVTLPPLRERLGDLGPLAHHLLARIADETGRRCVLEPDALAALYARRWPGNVRELYGALCRAVAAAGPAGRIGAEHLAGDRDEARAEPHDEPARRTSLLPPPSRLAVAPPVPRDELQGAALLALVAQLGGNLSRASRATGLARSTLRDRIARAHAQPARDASERDSARAD